MTADSDASPATALIIPDQELTDNPDVTFTRLITEIYVGQPIQDVLAAMVVAYGQHEPYDALFDHAGMTTFERLVSYRAREDNLGNPDRRDVPGPALTAELFNWTVHAFLKLKLAKHQKLHMARAMLGFVIQNVWLEAFYQMSAPSLSVDALTFIALAHTPNCVEAKSCAWSKSMSDRPAITSLQKLIEARVRQLLYGSVKGVPGSRDGDIVISRSLLDPYMHHEGLPPPLLSLITERIRTFDP